MGQVLDRTRDLWARPNHRGLIYSSGGKPADVRWSHTRWDWSMPIVGTYNATDMVPLAFGCPPVPIDKDRWWIGKIIHGREDVEKLAIPPVDASRCGEVLARTRQSTDMLPADAFIRAADTVSPLSIAELMWDDCFYTALIETPEVVHLLLDKITTFVIGFLQAQHQIAGERYVACTFPLIWSGPRGAYVGDDTLSLVSPEMHMEFSVPYLNRISDAFGGLYYHTCTLRPPYFNNLRQLRNLLGVNWNPGNSAPFHEILPVFSGRCIIAPHLYPDIHRTTDVLKWPGLHFADEVAFMQYCLDAMDEHTAMSWWFRSDICQNATLCDRLYDLLNEYGFAPPPECVGETGEG